MTSLEPIESGPTSVLQGPSAHPSSARPKPPAEQKRTPPSFNIFSWREAPCSILRRGSFLWQTIFPCEVGRAARCAKPRTFRTTKPLLSCGWAHLHYDHESWTLGFKAIWMFQLIGESFLRVSLYYNKSPTIWGPCQSQRGPRTHHLRSLVSKP